MSSRAEKNINAVAIRKNRLSKLPGATSSFRIDTNVYTRIRVMCTDVVETFMFTLVGASEFLSDLVTFLTKRAISIMIAQLLRLVIVLRAPENAKILIDRLRYFFLPSSSLLAWHYK